MSSHPARRRRRPRFGRFLRRLVFATAGLGLTIALAAGSIVYWEISSSLPSIDAVTEYRPPITTQIFSDDGTVIGEFFSEKRYLMPLDKIPAHVRNAFLAAEDDAFYRHKGVDLVSISRAFINNIAAGGKVQGGSTITQQVVKSLLLSPKKSYERKVKEILLSVRLEQQLTKDEILSLYLNHIYLGSGAYGVAAAALEYFGKPVGEIGIAEAALLGGLPQAPSRYSPFRHWPRAKARQRYVLDRMYEAGFITREERDAAVRQPLALATRKGSFVAAPYFVEHVRRMLEERYGRGALYDLGLRVRTTVNLNMQREAEAALRAGLDELAGRHGGYRSAFRDLEPAQREIYLAQQRLAAGESLERGQSYEAIVTSVRKESARVQVGRFTGDLVAGPEQAGALPRLELNDLIRVRLADGGSDHLVFLFDPSPPVEGALVAVDPHTGHIKAMAGGYDFERSQFNRAVQALRQPGSSFKPLVYAAALDRNFTPASIIMDSPVSYSDNGKVWSPKNFENRFFGPTSLREALTHSRNVVTVKLADRIGVGYLIKYLPAFGLRGPLPRNLSIALGTMEVTPLELAIAYTTFADNGLRPAPIFISEITDSQGEMIERNEPNLVQAIPAPTAYLITSMLQDVVSRGTGKRAQGLEQPTAGKTGTTNDLHDGWFVGYTPQLLAAVWVGFDNKQPLGKGETGGRIAAPIWKAFMEKAVAGMPVAEFPVPDGLKCVNVDPTTGGRAVVGNGARLECFRAGTEPNLAPGQVPPAVPNIQLTADAQPPKKSNSLDFLRNDF